jgi:predicted membrane protein
MKFTTLLLAIFIIFVQMLAVSGKSRKHRAQAKVAAKNKIKAAKNQNTACVGGKCSR